MNNLKMFGNVEQIMPYGGGGGDYYVNYRRCVCEEWYAGFAIISSIALAISVIVLILAIRDKKSKFRIPLIILSAIMIILCVASIIIAIGLYKNNAG